MALFIAEHTHPADRCPAGNPQMAPALLQIVSKGNASKHGIQIHGDAVANGGHHLTLILEGPSEKAVHEYLAPFGMVGTLKITPSSHCEAVVARGSC
jgi:uncharacterized protein DUF3303